METGISPHGISYIAYPANELVDLTQRVRTSLLELPDRHIGVGIIRQAAGCEFTALTQVFENVVTTWSPWYGARQGQWLHVVAAWTTLGRIELPEPDADHLLIHTQPVGRPAATYELRNGHEDLVVCPGINPGNSADTSAVKKLVFHRAPSLSVAPLREDQA